jgi:predicted RND superfamily exporter protein
MAEESTDRGERGSFWARYVAFAERRWALILVVVALIAAGAYVGLGHLTIDARIEALLPDDTPSQLAIAELKDRAATTAPLVLAVASDDPELNRRLAGEIREAVAEWPETRWAVDERSPEPFLDRRLLWLPAEELETLAERVDRLVEYQRCEANPMCFTLEDRPELPTEEELRELFLAQPEVEGLATFVGGGDGELPTDEESLGSVGGLCADGGRVCIVEASLEGNASNLGFASEILDRSRAVLDSVRPDDAPESLQLVVSGRYRTAPLTAERVGDDLQATSIAGLVLLVLLVIAQFRGPRAAFVLLAPVGLAILATLGILGFVHPTLNLISAFTLAILAGLGIDFGLHLLTHYGERRQEGEAPAEAMVSTLESMWRSASTAAATTACAVAALGAADFRGFAEMGLNAALGIGLSLLAFLFVFPWLVLLLDRLVKEKGSPTRYLPFDRIRSPGRGTLGAIVVGGVLLAMVGAGIGAGVVGPGLTFEQDFGKLQPPNLGHGISAVEDARGGTSGVMVYLLADDPEALEAAARDVAEREMPTDQTLLVTPRTLVPADQEAKLAAIGRMRQAVARVRGHLEGEALERVEAVEPLLAIDQPFTADDLPLWAKDLLVEADGSTGRMGLLYLKMRAADAALMEDLAGRIQTWREANPAVTFASPHAVLGEVVPGLQKDAPTMILLALLGLTIATLLIGRSVRRTLWVLSPVLLAAGMAAGMLVLVGVKLNLYDLLVVPVAFGVAIDGAVYVVWAMRDDRASELPTASRAVLGSTLTTMSAFGALMVASNPGLASIGHAAIVCIGLTIFTNLFWLPAALSLTGETRGQAPPSEPPTK